jgi:hypothetical protein
MTKKVILAALVGWAIAFIFSPRDLVGIVKPRQA